MEICLSSMLKCFESPKKHWFFKCNYQDWVHIIFKYLWNEKAIQSSTNMITLCLQMTTFWEKWVHEYNEYKWETVSTNDYIMSTLWVHCNFILPTSCDSVMWLRSSCGNHENMSDLKKLLFTIMKIWRQCRTKFSF